MEIQTELNKKSFWTLYNESQTKEKIVFLRLLKELCDILPKKHKSRRGKSLELSHIIFCLCMKSYCLKSGRRIIGELELCKRAKLIEKVPHFNSLFNYLKNPNLTLVLQDLIKITSLPLKNIERKFACDSTGFGMSVLDDRWSQIRQKYSKHHKYMKAHITYGVLSNIVTSCRVTEGTVADSPMLPEMVEETAENFKLEEWSADKAYLSKKNYQTIFKHGCLPFIPFKKNTSGKRAGGSMIWTEMYRFFDENKELYLKKYHLRSNSESGMMMIKSRFGDLTNMRNETGAINDVLSKILCHNFCILIQESFLLGINLDFTKFKDVSAQVKI